MFAFARNSALRPGAKLAMAVALATTTALGAAAIETPAQAQRNKKEKEQEAPKSNYSKKFVAAYQPVDALVKAGNAAEAKAQVAGVVAAVETPDDRNAAGGLVFNIGIETDDPAMQVQGVDMMIASGRLDAARAGQLNFAAYQLSSQSDNYDAARKHLEAAIAANYTFEGTLSDGTKKQFVADDMRTLIAETYFDQQNNAGGLTYLKGLIDERAAAGQTIPTTWILRGRTVAVQNELAPQAIDFARMYAQYYPSESSWGEAISVQRAMAEYDAQATLDLMRLAERTKALRDGRGYVDYIEAADARRLPAEVKRMIDQAVATGKLKSTDAFVVEVNQIAGGRVAAEKADQPALERDARAANGTATLATAAGDSFLSSGDAAKAEAMYRIALGKPGVDTARVLTRLGIALADQGKTAEATETFNQVQGDRAAIARLWAIHVQQKAGPTAVATTG